MSLNAWGWNEYFEAEFSRSQLPGKPARVVFASRGVCRVAGEGEETWVSTHGGEQPVTGDWIVYEPLAARAAGLLPRRTRISRKAAGGEVREQVLAANVDVVFLVTGLDADYNLRRLERYLVAVRQSGATPVVVLNKSDLCENALDRATEVDRLTLGAAPVVLISALEAGSAMQLHRYIEPEQTAVLLGSSGAGKSTIANALLGRAQQETRAVRDWDNRGRHTTTGRYLFQVPAGWLLIDTPGLRELEPWAPAAAVCAVFGDVEELAAECRFRDCRHGDEPGCAVRAAAANGRLDPARAENYRKLRDSTTALERKRRWKAIHRAMRHMPDKRR